MFILQILLIPLKLLVKLLGYILVAIMKVIGWFIKTVGGVCGLITAIIGGLIILAGIAFTIMVLCSAEFKSSLVVMDNWWLVSVACIIIGALLASLGNWSWEIGDWLSDVGDSIIFSMKDIALFPHKKRTLKDGEK